jgi:TonB family protein
MKLAAVLLLIALASSSRPQELSHTTEPAVVRKVEPEYTKEALDAKLEGNVVLSLVIGDDGVPVEIKVTRRLGMGLDQKAVECVRQWRFRPATSHSEPVSLKATVEVNFRLPQHQNQSNQRP